MIFSELVVLGKKNSIKNYFSLYNMHTFEYLKSLVKQFLLQDDYCKSNVE